MAPTSLRLVARSFSRRPVIIIAAILSLSLAIGANTALFSITDQMLLRMLPVKDPQKLVSFNWHGEFIGGSTRGLYDAFSYPAYADLRDGNPGAFLGIAAQYQDTADVTAQGPAQRAVVELVSGNYFDVLGVRPAVGRLLVPADNKVKGAEPYVVLSYEYWQRRFAGNPDVLNRVLDVNDHPMTVVGVARRGFAGFDQISPSDLFVPMMMKPAVTPTWDDLERRNSIWLHIFGRLKPGVSTQQAMTAMTIPFHHVLEGDLLATGRGARFGSTYLRDSLSFSEAAKGMRTFQQQFAKPLYVLLAMVVMLLLIACVNIANLLIVRAAAREKEIAIRLALGASRASLVRLALIESVCIAIAGGVFGLLIASGLTSVLAGFLPEETMAAAIQSQPDWRILAFTTALTVLTALFFGLVPALQSTRADLAPTLKSEAASVSLGGSQTRLRQALVCGQVALSLVLLFAAGLFAKSLHELLNVNSGIKVSHVVQFAIDPSLHKYTPQRSRQLFQDLQDKIRHLPGVLSASAVSFPVLSGENWQNTVGVEGYQPRRGDDMNPGFNETLPGLFTGLGVPLLAGRDFSERDIAGAPQVAIVNQTFVKRFVHDGRALGLHLGLGGQKASMTYEIVGVVPDVKGGDLKEAAKPYTYMALLQDEKPSAVTYYVRTVQDATAIVPEIRQQLRKLDASLPMYDVKTLTKQIDQTQFIDRLFALLSSAFGVLATLMAAIGLYGITSYSVARRTREIGIRVALGAEQGSVFRMVMREVLALTALGLLVGAPLVYWVGRIAASQIFEVRPTDPFVLTGALLTILAVSALAGALPARRATRIDPIEALRHE